MTTSMKNNDNAKNSSNLHQGSCLCGKVIFTVSEFLPRIAHCHCRMCQKFHGAAFSTMVEVKLEHLSWLGGKDALNSFTSENGATRQFYNFCGSSLFFSSSYNQQDKTVEISLASFDENINLMPDAHIYLASKVEWFQPCDNLVKYNGYREP